MFYIEYIIDIFNLVELVNKELPSILNFFVENLKYDIFNFKKVKKIISELHEKKEKNFHELKEDIELKWKKFKEKYQNKVIQKNYTTFLYENFNDFFIFYLDTFFGLDSNSLELVLKENISDTNLILEYNYYLSAEEIELYGEASTRVEGNLFGTLFFTGYVVSLVNVLGTIIKSITNEKILITLDCGIIKEEKNQKYLSFLILVRDNKKEILKNYCKMTLFYFLKQFPGIPDEFYEELLAGREILYNLALKEYGSVREKIADLLFYFYKKCKLLRNICPLLDFLNFVCSRVEDSVFNKIDVIKKDFLDNLDDSSVKKKSLTRIFKFIDKHSTLYSTFFANNLPGLKAQFNLFLLCMKYYFGVGSLEALEVGNILFLPEIFKNVLNQHNKNSINNINSKSIKDIGEIINYFYKISNIRNLNLFFRIIFNKDVSQVNYKFFRSFLKSFNKRFSDLINIENEILSETKQNESELTFNVVVDHLSRMLYVLIDKIFLKEKPEDASENFIDPRGRYIGKNIALRVLELFIFQEMNYSDDIWEEILISQYKEKIRRKLGDKVNIPEEYFYNEKDLAKLQTIYNLQSFSKVSYFEEYLMNEIIIPMDNFITKVRDSVKNLSNEIEIYEKLSEIVLKDVNVADKETIQDLKLTCQQIAKFWKISD